MPTCARLQRVLIVVKRLHRSCVLNPLTVISNEVRGEILYAGQTKYLKTREVFKNFVSLAMNIDLDNALSDLNRGNNTGLSIYQY